MAEQREPLKFGLKGYDPRPAYNGWAPGGYMRRCRGCDNRFTGDKRAVRCADCAYAFLDHGILPPSAASQPQQQDMGVETMLHPEPGQPSNPAVARLVAAARKVVGDHFSMQSLLDARRELADAIDALDEAVPPTGPTNEGHGR